MQHYRSCLEHAATSFAPRDGVEAGQGHGHAITNIHPGGALSSRYARVTPRTVGVRLGYAY